MTMGLILGIHPHREGDCVTIRVGGELDLSTTGRLRAELDASMIEPGVRKIVLDLRELQFCDSAGVATLLTSSRLAGVEGVRFVILGPTNPAAASVFDVTGLGDALPYRSSLGA
jgi:anti-sigma B factor antagonist